MARVAGVALLVAASMLVACSNKEEAPSAEETAKLIAPVARVEMAGAAPAGAAAVLRTGEQVVQTVCAGCHNTGVPGIPKMGDNAAWAPRLAQGYDAMLKSAIVGKGAMPPKGGAADLQDIEVARAVVYIANRSGGNFKEPPAPAAPAGAPADAASAPAAGSAPAAAK